MTLPLHHDLYLIAHDPSGRPLVHRSSLELGLAGAVLLELTFGGQVIVARGQAAAARRVTAPTGDPIADGLTGLLGAAPVHVRPLVKRVSAGMYEHVRDVLVTSGVLVRVSGRRMGLLPYTRYRLADISSVVRASSGVRSAVEGWKPPDARCAALCGLVAVLRVERQLYLDVPGGRLVGRLREIAAAGSPVVADLVGVVDTLVGEAAVAVYR
ncbi:GOLPH3/VPS74 family protein [Nonomuraea jiangxiensis]|uniref:Golgi phosphoprotein 3 (GPP34) n=1 Tax=Nonomuraea jiangxiensis TaxID=633440 RepID=A0A1G7Z667_9ACTN|nr:GPP34 family phosphoprotein [Nonomuraea jiangxiensis]SDH03996.1 Golgi phosphoprotein 3 (GPP34) [Nonomuraea jiangxiensis]